MRSAASELSDAAERGLLSASGQQKERALLMKIKVFTDNCKNRIKPLHGVGNAPIDGVSFSLPPCCITAAQRRL